PTLSPVKMIPVTTHSARFTSEPSLADRRHEACGDLLWSTWPGVRRGHRTMQAQADHASILRTGFDPPPGYHNVRHSATASRESAQLAAATSDINGTFIKRRRALSRIFMSAWRSCAVTQSAGRLGGDPRCVRCGRPRCASQTEIDDA